MMFYKSYTKFLKTQYKFKWHLAKYSECNAQFNDNSNVIPLPGIYKMLIITIFLFQIIRKEYMDRSQLKVIGVFEILLLVV